MNTEQRIAFVIARAADLNARIAGMTAENMQRAACGHSMAYDDAAFCKVADEYAFDYNSLTLYLRGEA